MIMLVCDNCKAEFSLAPVDILSNRVQLKGQDYIIRYFVCPKCNRVYVFLFLKFEDLGIILSRENIHTQYQMALKCKNVALSKRLFGRYDSLGKLLEDHMRKELSNFPNGFVYDKAAKIISYREK